MAAIQQRTTSRMPLQIVRGDWNAFLTLGTDNLAKIVILPAILIGTFHLGPDIVFGRILPGLSLTLFVGLGIFGYLGIKLGAVQERSDATALPYGISTPAMFVFLFGIVGPVYFASNDPLLAYRIGLGAAFLGGLIELSGAVIGPFLQRVTPKAGILGTMAGVAIVWIAMIPSAIIFANPIIGLPALFVVLLGLVGRFQFPFRLPAGLVAIVLGVLLGFIMGESSIRFDDLAFHAPLPVLGDLIIGVRLIVTRPEILAVVIPISIYNLIETTGNLESARAAGDEYDIRKVQLIDGFGTCLGALFGSPFPTTVYLGHPAYKEMGARTGYVLLTGLLLLIASLVGVFAFLQHLIPAAAISPLLVFVGIVMTHYAFQATPPAHGVAVAFALVPHIADLLKKQLDGTLLEVLQQGSAPSELMSRLAENQGVYLQSYGLLSRGAIITGLLWGSILSFLVDQDLRKATIFSLAASLLSLTGLIHAEQIGISLSPITIGYLVLTVILGLLHLANSRRAKAYVQASGSVTVPDPVGSTDGEI
ncbi:MAG TPA: xanthine/uracil/vitamin C permease [Anaerolineae bacterium]|nr:xanthine/uracil/vitamin C permease [Anaerolineae bacterium]